MENVFKSPLQIWVNKQAENVKCILKPQNLWSAFFFLVELPDTDLASIKALYKQSEPT